jgi:acyl carrier protein
VSVEARVLDIVASALGLEPGTVSPEASVVMDLGADSLGLAELAVQLEREFRLEIHDRDMAQVETVADIVRLIEEHGRASGDGYDSATVRAAG